MVAGTMHTRDEFLGGIAGTKNDGEYPFHGVRLHRNLVFQQ
jgi:hypothetical protein